MLSNGSMIFPSVSASMSVSTQNFHASPLSQVAHLHFFHLFKIYLCFQLRMLSDDSVIFSVVLASMSIDTQNFSFLCHPEGTNL